MGQAKRSLIVFKPKISEDASDQLLGSASEYAKPAPTEEPKGHLAARGSFETGGAGCK